MSAISRLPKNEGFTLLEILVVMGLTVMLLAVGYTALVHVRGGLTHTYNAHQLEMEIGDVSDLLGGLLRRSDPRSVAIHSSEFGPWSQIQFAADGHQYHFYGENGGLFYTVDDLQPKRLSGHLKNVQFALSESSLPTLLTWSVSLSAPSGALQSPSVTSITATQYLMEPAE